MKTAAAFSVACMVFLLALECRPSPAEPQRGFRDAQSQRGLYPSPDHRFVAVITEGDGESAELNLYPSGLSEPQKNVALHPLAHFYSVNHIFWLSNKAHALLIATGGSDYGKGYLVLWSGRSKILRAAAHESGEGYDLLRVSQTRAGASVVYDHFGADGKKQDGPDYVKKSLMLIR